MTKPKEHFIIVTGIDVSIKVSKRTYYKIFNEEVGIKRDDGYAISIQTLKKYKKLYNKIRGL